MEVIQTQRFCTDFAYIMMLFLNKETNKPVPDFIF